MNLKHSRSVSSIINSFIDTNINDTFHKIICQGYTVLGHLDQKMFKWVLGMKFDFVYRAWTDERLNIIL